MNEQQRKSEAGPQQGTDPPNIGTKQATGKEIINEPFGKFYLLSLGALYAVN